MDIREIIAREEQEFPRLFSFYEERQYGVLFYNAGIRDHYDSNHAILYPGRISDLGAVLDDIREFYQGKEIVPAIYHPSVEQYFIDNARVLKSHGYEFMTALDSRVMVLEGTDILPLSGTLEIRRITDRGMIESGDFFVERDDYLTEIYKNCLSKKNHYLFVGFFEDKPVALLSLHVSEYGCTRFDEMKTAEAYRNRGFAREMNRFAANFCVRNGLPVAYQWPAHGTSERITAQAGFRVAFALPAGWASYAIKPHYIE